jgi:site-specific DNA-methyltransferase (adenine-specific)
MDKQNRIYWAKGGSGWPQEKRYRDELKGKAVADLWDDIARINPVGSERLGFPTQKPQALLERIVLASSNEGDVVLDPFCGCGTSIAASERLQRRWIGIDVTHLAIGLIRSRLETAFAGNATFTVVGEPKDLAGAEVLASEAPYQFQAWALGLIGARPAGDIKKGADKGIDGRLFFRYGPDDKYKQVVLSVKAGKLHANYVRDLRGVMEREKAEIAALMSFDEPTKKMYEEAASAGFFSTPWGDFPRLQLLTVAELLEGKRLQYPVVTGLNQTLKAAPKAAATESGNVLTLDLEGEATGQKATSEGKASKARRKS